MCFSIPSFGIEWDRKKGKERGSKGLFIFLLLKQLTWNQHALGAWLGSGRAEQEINAPMQAFKRISVAVKT